MEGKESSKVAILEMVNKMSAEQLSVLEAYANGLLDMKAKKGE